VRSERADALALQVDHEPEYPVGAGVLWAHVDAHALRLERAQVLTLVLRRRRDLGSHQFSLASPASRLLVSRDRGPGTWVALTPSRVPPFQPVRPGSRPVRPARNEGGSRKRPSLNSVGVSPSG